MSPLLPQEEFGDLYSSVYAILDDAKTTYDLVKLYKGSHGSSNPHPRVLGFGAFFFRCRRGLFGYADSLHPEQRLKTAADLDWFDDVYRPRVSFRTAFDILSSCRRPPSETTEEYLHYLVSRQHCLGPYRGASSGLDDESRAFMLGYFRQLGLRAALDDVLIFCGGLKVAFIAFCASVMCRRRYDQLDNTGGRILAPEGYYQSLRLIPAIFGGSIDVVPDITGTSAAQWLNRTDGMHGRAIYVALVNNADGRLLDRRRAVDVARTVLMYNRTHPENPAYVLGDDVYEGSYLFPDGDPQPIGGITGRHVGDPTLGRMSDWTVSVVTSSKTCALPTSRVAFAMTTNRTLRAALTHYRTVFSLSRAPQVDELTATAALCLTPQRWIDSWNQCYRSNLEFLCEQLRQINARLGFPAYRVEPPAAGWYFLLHVSRRLFPPAVTSGLDAFAVLLHYGHGRPNTGVGLLPGELFGYHYGEQLGDAYMMRGTLARPLSDLQEFAARLYEAATTLQGHDRLRIVRDALHRARAVADVDAILRHRRY